MLLHDCLHTFGQYLSCQIQVQDQVWGDLGIDGEQQALNKKYSGDCLRTAAFKIIAHAAGLVLSCLSVRARKQGKNAKQYPTESLTLK